jgi:hypothetical protein
LLGLAAQPPTQKQDAGHAAAGKQVRQAKDGASLIFRGLG